MYGKQKIDYVVPELQSDCRPWDGPVKKIRTFNGEYTVRPISRIWDSGAYKIVDEARRAWRLRHGKTPRQLTNICGNPRCVNPGHWEEYRALKYYCPKGHIVDVDDVSPCRDERYCAECARERARVLSK